MYLLSSTAHRKLLAGLMVVFIDARIVMIQQLIPNKIFSSTTDFSFLRTLRLSLEVDVPWDDEGIKNAPSINVVFRRHIDLAGSTFPSSQTFILRSKAFCHPPALACHHTTAPGPDELDIDDTSADRARYCSRGGHMGKTRTVGGSLRSSHRLT